MDISPALFSSAQGIHRNLERMNAAAARLAQSTDNDPIEPLVDLMTSRHAVEANIHTFRVAARLYHHSLDLLA